MKTKEEIRIEFYGEHDARAYDHDELYIMEQYAKEYHEQQVNLLNKPAVSNLLNCDHEWKCDTFDCYGFPMEQYCDKCGEKKAI